MVRHLWMMLMPPRETTWADVSWPWLPFCAPWATAGMHGKQQHGGFSDRYARLHRWKFILHGYGGEQE